MTKHIYIDSYYRNTLVDAPLYPPLRGDVDADVCIIGGGFAGLTAARQLLKLGKSVVLIEGKRIAWGASGRNGGFVSDGYAQGLADLEARVGFDHAKALYDLSRQGTNYVRQTIAELDAPGVPVEEGWLRVLRHSSRSSIRGSVERQAESYGIALDYWPVERVREVLLTERYFEGMSDPDAFHIQPLNYAIALAKDVVALGGVVHEGTEARALRRQGAEWLVECALPEEGDGADAAVSGRVRCGSVLLCGSAYMQDLYPKLERAVLPVATYVVTSEPMSDRLAGAIRYRGCIGDTRRAGDYYRLVEDGSRLLWGGRITTRRSEPQRLSAMLKKDILSIYPQLGDFKVAFAWSGLMGYCIHKMPILRQMEPGLWAATATGGHGLNTTATLGMVVAEAIAGAGDRYRLFEPFKARWGGGSLGRAGTQLVYWGMQMRDAWDEFRS